MWYFYMRVYRKNIPEHDESPPKHPSSSPEKHSWMFWKKQRYIIALLAFVGFINNYTLRTNMSIAIVAMVENKSTVLENKTVVYQPEFDWDSKTQGYVLGAFFYGYLTTQFIGGWLSAKLGGKRILGLGIGITAFLTLLTPLAAKTSVYLLVILRTLVGVFDGVTYPSIYSIWSRWAPPLERSRLLTIAFSGSYFGTVVTMPISAYLANNLGWPSTFYFFGGAGILWFIVWWTLVTESPADHPSISKEELEYIQKSLGEISASRNIKHPWKDIFRSPAVWALVVSHFAANWGFYTILIQLPTFMEDMFNYDLEKTEFLFSLPYIAMAVTIQFAGQLADLLREKKIFSTTTVRKIFTCTAFVAHAIFMAGVGFCQTLTGTMVLLILVVGFGVFTWGGFGVNYLDIAPMHASVIIGISNTFATLAGVFTPIVTGYIVTTPKPEEWQIVFYIASGIFLLGTVVYGFCASGELQPWAVQDIPPSKDEATEAKSNG